MFDRFWKVSVLLILALILVLQGADAYFKYRMMGELQAGKAEFEDKARRLEEDLDFAKREFRRLNDTIEFLLDVAEETLGIRPHPKDPPRDQKAPGKIGR